MRATNQRVKKRPPPSLTRERTKRRGVSIKVAKGKTFRIVVGGKKHCWVLRVGLTVTHTSSFFYHSRNRAWEAKKNDSQHL